MSSYAPAFGGAGRASGGSAPAPTARSGNIKLPAKAKGKGKSKELPPIDAVTDIEEAITYGIQSEERGERYASSAGPTAERAYKTALAWYNRAFTLSQSKAQAQGDYATLIQCADAAYNAARVHYLLSMQFAFPPASLRRLEQAIELYTQAAAAEEAARQQQARAQGAQSETLLTLPPSLFKLDIEYNLAVAQLAAAELVFQLHGSQSEAASGAHAIVSDAIARLERVQQGQLAELASTQVADSEASAPDGPESPPAADSEDATHDASDGEMVMGYSASTITWSSVSDTIENCFTGLRLRFTEQQGIGADEGAIREAEEIAKRLLASIAAPPAGPAGTNVGPSDSAADGWSQAKSDLLLLELQTALADARLEAAELAVAQGAAVPPSQLESAVGAICDLQSQAVQARLPPLASDASTDAHQQLICQLAEAQGDLAWLGVRALALIKAAQSPQPPAVVESTWACATAASKLFLQALADLAKTQAANAVPGSAVLGTSSASKAPSSASRARLSINSSLCELSLLRALPCFAYKHVQQQEGKAELAGSPQVAAWLTAKSLLVNARIYARRACSDAGLACALPLQAHAMMPGGVARLASSDSYRQAVVSGAGASCWELLLDTADSLLLCARAVWLNGQHHADGLQLDGMPEAALKDCNETVQASQQELNSLHNAAWWLCRLPTPQSSANAANPADEAAHQSAWRLALTHSRDDHQPTPGGRFVEELLKQNGELDREAWQPELRFWAAWSEGLMREPWAPLQM